ncbi:MAG: right-handed parallel beta-helix repeat-containing protein [Ignavibacteria bacterium]|nr:right-handed parallel beta-helix repeat-containing protein [Ignavibacteria bacterium]
MKNIKKFLFIIIISFILSINNYTFSQLHGTFTIGTGGDYNKIASAILTLHAIGVDGPVVFNILSGVYEERQLVLNSISGSSEINTVTFKSQTGNYNNVTVNNPLDSGYTLLINGADNITFKNIYFQNISSVTLKTAVKFTGECDNIKILNNKFWGSSTDMAIGSVNAKMSNLEIANNLFTIRNAVYLPENLLVSENTKIYGNTFSNCQFGITASKHYTMTIENNVMSILQGYGIYVGDCNGDLKILKNKITPHVFQYYYTIDGIKVAPFSGTSCLIANNMISVPQGTGMYIANCVNTKIFYNTIRASSVYSGDLALTSNTGVNLKNNIYVQLANSALRH